MEQGAEGVAAGGLEDSETILVVEKGAERVAESGLEDSDVESVPSEICDGKASSPSSSTDESDVESVQSEMFDGKASIQISWSLTVSALSIPTKSY
jgi:hypothetical protein